MGTHDDASNGWQRQWTEGRREGRGWVVMVEKRERERHGGLQFIAVPFWDPQKLTLS